MVTLPPSSRALRRAGRNPALIKCDAGYKAGRGRVLTPLFELRAHEWRNAVDSHHTPFSGSALFVNCIHV